MSSSSNDFISDYLSSKSRERERQASVEQLKVINKPEIARLASELSEKASKDVQDLVHKAQNASLTEKQQEILTATADYRRESAKRIEDYMFDRI